MKRPPPAPDPRLEQAFPPSLRAALDEYLELERRVQPVASGSCAPVCAACRNPCCEADFCAETWEAPWLRAATSRPGAIRRVPASQAIEGHLAKDGCRVRFGRPPVCYEFACSSILTRLRSDDEKYLFRVISHTMTFAGEEALPRTHLVEIEDLSKLAGRRVARLRRRIALAGRVFEAAARLFRIARAEAAGLARAGRRDDWALVTRWFPPRRYKLSGLGHAPPAPAPVPSGGKPRMLRSLPIVRSALAAALALVLPLLAACGAPPRRLELTRPKPAEASVFRNDDVQFRFAGTGERLDVEILNRSKERLVVPWWKARFVAPDGAEREVVAFEGEPTRAHLQDERASIEVAPQATWRGTVHPRDRLRAGSGARVVTMSLLTAEEAEGERTVGLDVEIEVGRRPERLEFRFIVKPAEAGAS